MANRDVLLLLLGAWVLIGTVTCGLEQLAIITAVIVGVGLALAAGCALLLGVFYVAAAPVIAAVHFARRRADRARS